MDRDQVMRRALRLTAIMNFGGALAFAFPRSLGHLAGFPPEVPLMYSATLAALVALFGGTYAWLARQPQIDRPMVVFCALGKASFFAVVLMCWIFGEVPARAVVGASADLAFASLFAWWLLGDVSDVARFAPASTRPLQ